MTKIKREIKKSIYNNFNVESGCLAEIVNLIADKSISIDYLISLKDYIENNFNCKKLTLSILDGGTKWRTLFFHIDTTECWENASNFYGNLLIKVCEECPAISRYINFSITPYCY